MEKIKHLQSVLLMMVKDIDQICRDNKIDYYLEGGSALGAIRHRGFIPWDDDLDITMDINNYKKFIRACKLYLDKEKYCIQEAQVDWPCYLTKIRLRNTFYDERSNTNNDPDMHGIFIDVFIMNNAPSERILQLRQYVFAKFLLAYHVSVSGDYHTNSILKKIALSMSKMLNNRCLRNYFMRQVEAYDNQSTDYLGSYFNITNFHNSIIPKKVYGVPKYVKFEDTILPVPELYDEYLTTIYGDYMTPPPPQDRIPSHSQSINFGKY